jgi:hypothetical protein
MKSRFLKSIVATSKTQSQPMPWTRGKRREAMIKRQSDRPMRKSA